MVFEITPENIEALTDTDLRTLIGKLAEQETTNLGYSAVSVTYGGHQNSKDGGIDVRVDLPYPIIKGFIPCAKTGFQVKAEDMPRNAIIREMRPGGKLRPSIIRLGEVEGAYVIVSSKGSVSDTFLAERKNAMIEAIADMPNAERLHIDFYDKRRIATWVNQHAALIPWVRSRIGLPITGWRPFEDWSSSPGAPNESYLTDTHVRLSRNHSKNGNGLNIIDGINNLREILSKPKGVVRLVGLSGVGKTRLAQALFDESVGSNYLDPSIAIYTDISDGPDPVPIELLIRIQNIGKKCVLIIDNCGIELHQKLVARMKNSQTLISLLTIEYDVRDDETENTDTFKLEPSSSYVIEKILERRHPHLNAPEIRTISTFSEGNSRIALALAETSKEGQSLANLQDSSLIKRLFHQNHQENSELLRAANICSLVYSFDGETFDGNEAELPILAELGEQSISQMHRHIAELQRRQLVQKRSKWRALLPHALAHRLAKQTLQDIPLEILKKKFIDIAPKRMLKSFSHRLGCLHDSTEAQTIVTTWLRKGGILSDIENLDQDGIDILRNIAPVNPNEVLGTLQQSANRNSVIFDNKNPYRAQIIDLLRLLAYEPHSFNDAVSLIMKFIQPGKISNVNSEAINVFKSLFYLYLSGTHANATQRADFLKKLAQSIEPEDHFLVLTGLEAMLKTSHFTSVYNFEFGTRKRDFGFYPKSEKEVVDWYRAVFNLAGDLSDIIEYRTSVRSKIAHEFRFLAQIEGVTDELIALADRFNNNDGWSQAWEGIRVAVRQCKKAKRINDAAKLEALANRLKPITLTDRISIYVLPEQYSPLDVAEFDFNDEKSYQKIQKKIEEICSSIGKELANDLPALIANLFDMLQSKSSRVLIVAQSIGRETSSARTVWDLIISKIESSDIAKTTTFLSYFLLGLAEKNKTEVEILLDEALSKSTLHPLFVHMQATIEVDLRGSRRIIEATKFKTIPANSFFVLQSPYTYRNLSSKEFKQLIFAIGKREDALYQALEIFYMRLHSKKNNKISLEQDDLEAGCQLIDLITFDERDQYKERTLIEIAKTCLRPTDTKLVEQFCNRLYEAIMQYKVSVNHYSKLISEIGALFPRIVLNVFIDRLKYEREDLRYIMHNLRDGRQCPFNKIDHEVMIEWANEKPDYRFIELAGIILPWEQVDKSNSNNFDDDAGAIQWTKAALSILYKAPEPEQVLSKYYESICFIGWTGPKAHALTRRLVLLEYLTHNLNSTIADAANQAINSLKREIKNAQERESFRDRHQDERFEW